MANLKIAKTFLKTFTTYPWFFFQYSTALQYLFWMFCFFWEQTPHKRKKSKIIPKNTFFDKSKFSHMKLNNNNSKDYYEMRLQNLNTYGYEKLGCVLTIHLESTSNKTSYLPENEGFLAKLPLKVDSLETSLCWLVQFSFIIAPWNSYCRWVFFELV